LAKEGNGADKDQAMNQMASSLEDLLEKTFQEAGLDVALAYDILNVCFVEPKEKHVDRIHDLIVMAHEDSNP
jgi:hypothetical protein